jgi:hypothetical protein
MGSSSRPASSVQTQVRQEYPAFFQPHLEDVLSSAKSEFGREYIPFPEARLVETPAARTQALTDLQDTGLARLGQPTYDEAITGTREAGKTFPDYDIEAYMNPYRQLVTDQLLDKTRERRDIGRKSIDAAAARAGAFGGGRHGVERGLYEEGTQEQLGDIQERGDMAAFANALSAIQADKTAGLQSSKQLAELGSGKREDLTKGLIGMEKAATAEEAIAQRIRDYGFQDFKEQVDFPQQKLAEYSAIIRGHTPPPNRWETRDVQQAFSPLQTGVGAMTALGGLFGGKATGGTVGYHSGDRVDGLSSLVRKPSRENNSPRDVVNESIDILMGMAGEPRYVNTDAQERERKDNKKYFDDYKKREQEKKRKEALEFERMMNPNNPVIPIPRPERPGIHEDRLRDLHKQGQDVAEASFSEEVMATMASGGSISDQNLSTYMREGSRSIPPEARTRIKEMYESNGLAYGGVPGQAYTEDIGTVGGLGAIAGPQMRFAYGGVPGQPYTEDIGMMGGLAAVAGPQMRFQSGSGVGLELLGMTDEEIKRRRIGDPSQQPPMMTSESEVGKFISDVMEKRETGEGDIRYEGLRHPTAEEWKAERRPNMISGNPFAAVGVTEEQADIYNLRRSPSEGDAEEVSGTLTEEMSDADKAGVWYGVEDMMIDEKGKPQPKKGEAGTPEEKEKAWFEKLGLTQKETIGLGLTLMQGTPDALALAGKSLLGKKELSDLDRKYKEAMVDYANARTASEKGKSGRDMFRILSTIKSKNENFRLKVRRLAFDIMKDDRDAALRAWDSFARDDQIGAMTILNQSGIDAKELEKNPELKLEAFRKAVQQFSNLNPAQSRTEGVASVSETVEKATGGTIPNTLSKLGISGIRKV